MVFPRIVLGLGWVTIQIHSYYKGNVWQRQTACKMAIAFSCNFLHIHLAWMKEGHRWMNRDAGGIVYEKKTAGAPFGGSDMDSVFGSGAGSKYTAKFTGGNAGRGSRQICHPDGAEHRSGIMRDECRRADAACLHYKGYDAAAGDGGGGIGKAVAGGYRHLFASRQFYGRLPDLAGGGGANDRSGFDQGYRCCQCKRCLCSSGRKGGGQRGCVCGDDEPAR